jgi:hypothetical protein
MRTPHAKYFEDYFTRAMSSVQGQQQPLLTMNNDMQCTDYVQELRVE